MMIQSVGRIQAPAQLQKCSVSGSKSASFSQFSGLKIAAPGKLTKSSLTAASPSAGKSAAPVSQRIVAQGAATEEAATVTEDVSRLTPRVEIVDGYWRLKPEFRTSINPAEKTKLEDEPMKLWTERRIEELARTPFAEIDSSKQGKDDVDVRLKWLGLFHRRKHQYGRFMMRLKLPNGVTTSEQTRFLASVIEKYGAEGCADVTTRQNWQIRGVLLEDVPALMDGLTRVGLTSIQSGMDNVRNAVGNPIAGIDPHEIIDTRPAVMALNDYIVNRGKGNLSITNLPRKWNVCVIGTHDLFEHPHINDLAYIPALKDGRMGFNLLVGGFFSSKRDAEAIPLDAWVSEADVVPLCKAMLEAFRDLGSRGNRQKCRMMWLIDELGIEAFRAEVEKRLPSQKLERAAESDLLDTTWKRRDLLGVHPQKQPGLSFVGIHVPVGRLQAADMFEFARIADQYGSGELRLTVEQNIIVPNVPDAKVSQLLQEPLVTRFGAQPTPLVTNLVSCTGKQFCGMAIIETKNRALAITQELEASMNFTKPVRMHWTGCPNSCAQVQVADIGFMGTMARDENNKPTDGVDIFLGGKVGAESHLGTKVRTSVPIKDLIPVVQEILIERFGATLKA
ncbi:ferredoxin-nitrite reductase [Marchantia polymorpha subsp. ruderalis]|uniref:Ferredoxin--nitrite reductase, chloroplastic n=2 Tax=Marchantia polymorpha TaxID=3197 RepID=A0AAF6B4F9_MARPO|nr:hypothetical protein MARPO_0183s0004 [Marchantia polymorpha]BBN06893.1 hypothetical protein Mp_3g24720 [Marchantia polymorpha subsp. ruderalis]|eukprot:PTQ27798.1 hypothetical protein MARPO_0183s0004 [Marchantia polymorpha]